MIADDARITPPHCKQHMAYDNSRLTPHRCKKHTASFPRSTGKFPSNPELQKPQSCWKGHVVFPWWILIKQILYSPKIPVSLEDYVITLLTLVLNLNLTLSSGKNPTMQNTKPWFLQLHSYAFIPPGFFHFLVESCSVKWEMYMTLVSITSSGTWSCCSR